MNVLDTVLCTSNAEEYANHFKQFRIDAHTLKLLSDEDLKIIGVTEEEKRASILQHAANLQIPAEKHIEVIIDKKYMESVLLQMSAQLMKHLAALSIAVNRKDVIICNVKLARAVKCLRDCVLSLDQQLNEFEEEIVMTQKSQNNLKKAMTPTILTLSLLLVSYKFWQYVLN